MPFVDAGAQKTYQRDWVKRRRTEWLQANGPCSHCGSTKALEIDHKNPRKKKFPVAQIWSRSKSVREKELRKCQALCLKCHRRKTSEEYKKNRKHGTNTKYKKDKCRCSRCRKAHAEVNRKYR